MSLTFTWDDTNNPWIQTSILGAHWKVNGITPVAAPFYPGDTSDPNDGTSTINIIGTTPPTLAGVEPDCDCNLFVVQGNSFGMASFGGTLTCVTLVFGDASNSPAFKGVCTGVAYFGGSATAQGTLNLAAYNDHSVDGGSTVNVAYLNSDGTFSFSSCSVAYIIGPYFPVIGSTINNVYLCNDQCGAAIGSGFAGTVFVAQSSDTNLPPPVYGGQQPGTPSPAYGYPLPSAADVKSGVIFDGGNETGTASVTHMGPWPVTATHIGPFAITDDHVGPYAVS